MVLVRKVGIGPVPHGPPQGAYSSGPYGSPPQYGTPPGHWPQQAPAQQPQSGVSIGRIVLGVVLGIVIVISVGYVWISFGGTSSRSSSSSSSLGGSVPEAPKLSLRNPQIITDEDLVVSAGGSQMRGFSIPSSRPVKVAVDGKQDTAKGFNVYVMKDSEWTNFKAHEEFRYVPVLSSPKTRSFSNTADLPTGSWCVVVQNSENIINDMTVHVKVIVDPD